MANGYGLPNADELDLNVHRERFLEQRTLLPTFFIVRGEHLPQSSAQDQQTVIQDQKTIYVPCTRKALVACLTLEEARPEERIGQRRGSTS